MKAITSLVLGTAILTAAASASAQFAKPEDAIKYRKNALFVMAQHFGRIGAMVNGKVAFDAKAAADNAVIAENMSKLPWAAFGEGTDMGDTKAKAEIWKEQAKFKQAAEKLQAEMSKLALAAQSGNQDSIKAAFTASAGACKNCHDAYRSK